MTTPRLIKSIGRSPSRLALLLTPLVFACFALSPAAQAQLPSPSPDGGYPNNNTAEGDKALFSLMTGAENTAVGAHSLRHLTFGDRNTGVGAWALGNNTASGNTAVGEGALFGNTSGSNNTATGVTALFYNETGRWNTANGADALHKNMTGDNNTATGFGALERNTASDNTANGAVALSANTTGTFNTASGAAALNHNTTGGSNTAIGYSALFDNTIGTDNTASGVKALQENMTGSHNTAMGVEALMGNSSGNSTTAIGYRALRSASGGNNTALGWAAGFSQTIGTYNVYIGSAVVGSAGENNRVRIADNLPVGAGQSACYIGGISRQEPGFPSSPVYIGLDGKLGVSSSSKRFKEHIKPMDKASEAVLALKPVTFQYKSDKNSTPQFGLIAEEVADVSPDLVVRDEEGKPYSVRYDQVNAMLLNEFLKEHRKAEQLTKNFESKLAEQQKQIEALTAGLQKVSAQVEVSRPAPQTVTNNQ